MTRQAWASRGDRAPLSNQIALFFGRRFFYLAMGVLYRLQLEGREHIPPRGPLIVVANHQSYLDPILLGMLAWTRTFRAMAKSSLFRFGPFGRLISLFGALPVDQHKGDLATIRVAIDEVNAGHAVIIYPEGGRTRDGRVRPFQRGFQVILKRTRAPVLPVTIEGAYDVWPAGRPLPRLSGRIIVRAHPVIPHEAFVGAGAERNIEALRRTIEARRLALRREIRQRSRGRFPVEASGDLPAWEGPPPIGSTEA